MRTAQRRQVCILLPNKQHLDCTISVRAKGHEVLNIVQEHLGLTELHVLSLAVLRANEYLFLDLEQRISKYFDKRWNRSSLKIPFMLFLRVQYYVQRGQLISSTKVQELYYAELRQKVLQSQSHHQEALFFQLAACALQAEVGDLELTDSVNDAQVKEKRGQDGKQKHYFLPEDYFPSWLIKRRGRDFLLRHSPTLHDEMRGVSRGQAILRFIKEASSLQDGSVTFYRMRQGKKEQRSLVLFGVGLRGVQLYQEVEGRRYLLYDFSWTDIERFTFQGSRFEVSAVGSLCLSKLVYYTASAFHSKHILRHLSDSHRLHINTRDAVCSIQELENMEASQFYNEAYICDTVNLKHRLQSLTSSMSDCSVAIEENTAWFREEEEDNDFFTEFELSVDEPEELLVDDPDEVSWLAELLSDVPVSGPPMFPFSHWAAVTMEMKQVFRHRADEGVSVD